MLLVCLRCPDGRLTVLPSAQIGVWTPESPWLRFRVSQDQADPSFYLSTRKGSDTSDIYFVCLSLFCVW